MSLYLLTLLTVVPFFMFVLPMHVFVIVIINADKVLSFIKRNTDPVIRHNTCDDYRCEKRKKFIKCKCNKIHREIKELHI